LGIIISHFASAPDWLGPGAFWARFAFVVATSMVTVTGSIGFETGGVTETGLAADLGIAGVGCKLG